MTYLRKALTPTERFTIASEDCPASLEAAYEAMREFTANTGEVWRGWKLGGTNHATQAAFGVTRGYFGPLHASEIFETPGGVRDLPLCEIKGEVELALRIDPEGTGYDAWCVALEMPASAIENLPEAGVAALIADRCGAGALLLGPVHDGALPDLNDARFALTVNGAPVSEAGLDALVASPDQILDDFIALARDLGFRPGPGDWVATGGITACRPFASGDAVEVRLDGDTVLAFHVEDHADA